MRSEASLERRRVRNRERMAELRKSGYFAIWRGAHKSTEAERKSAWKAAHPEKVREGNRRYRARRDRTSVDVPSMHTGHPLFEAARSFVGEDRNSGLTVFRDPLHEDLLSEAVVALLEERDPAEAVKRYWSREYDWRHTIAPIFTEVAA